MYFAREYRGRWDKMVELGKALFKIILSLVDKWINKDKAEKEAKQLELLQKMSGWLDVLEEHMKDLKAHANADTKAAPAEIEDINQQDTIINQLKDLVTDTKAGIGGGIITSKYLDKAEILVEEVRCATGEHAEGEECDCAVPEGQPVAQEENK